MTSVETGKALWYMGIGGVITYYQQGDYTVYADIIVAVIGIIIVYQRSKPVPKNNVDQDASEGD